MNMNISNTFSRIKRIPYSTCTIQDKLVLVYSNLNKHKEESGQYAIEGALKFFIKTPLNHELSLKHFNNTLWKYSVVNDAPYNEVVSSILMLADNYGRINNPLEVAKELFGNRYPSIEKAVIDHIAQSVKETQSEDKKISIVKQYDCLGLTKKIKSALIENKI